MIERDGVLVEEHWMLAVSNIFILVLLVLLTGASLVDDCLVLQVDVKHDQVFVLLQDICVAVA